MSYKYSNWSPMILVDFYGTKASSYPDAWPATKNTSLVATNINTTSFMWSNTAAYSDTIVLCPPGYQIKNSSLQDCSQCTDSNCEECSYLNLNKCFNCSVGFQLNNGLCDPIDCLKGQYFDFTQGSCINCLSPCSVCLNSTACLSCQTGFLYVDDQSYQCIANTTACPVGTNKDPVYPICRKCPQYCTTCSNLTTCTVCMSGYFLSNGLCVRACPSNSYLDQNAAVCRQCGTNCQICNSVKCLQCVSGYLLDTATSTCVTTCPAGTYAELNSRVCMICQPFCSQCVGNNYTCTACKSGYYLYNQSCVSRCPYLGYFHNTTVRECQTCNSNCQICINSASDCISCKPGVLSMGRSCQSACPPLYYATQTGQCYPCHSNCEECYGSLKSMCTKCALGHYLYQNTCDTNCPQGLFQDNSLLQCSSCKYYCDVCTSLTNCVQCKQGYRQISSYCQGEYFLRTTSSFALSLPINTNTMPTNINLVESSTELWFKSDQIGSSNLEVILGLSPYKLRKKASQASIQVNFQGILNYCDTSTLLSNTWYHFAFTLKESSSELKCYLDGASISIGSNPSILIASNILRPFEATVGGTIDPKGTESNFIGYIKEFRFWKVQRSEFQIANFKNIALTLAPPSLLIYWRLDERNDGSALYFTDSSGAGANIMNPISAVPSFTVNAVVEMREIYLKICPEGQYSSFNTSLKIQECLNCNSACKNCRGPGVNDCTECNPPYKLLEKTYQCLIIDSCPDGYYMDSITQLCYQCDPYCQKCQTASNICQSCKEGYFRQYRGTGCIDQCPLGMYGNYQLQVCLFLPQITSVLPLDGSIFSYGSFIDTLASFQLANQEPLSSITYNWQIKRMARKNYPEIDITEDVIKRYYQTDILKVHLDKNVLEPNFFYNVTFYIKGDEELYKDFYTSKSVEIYIGIPPKGGKCDITPTVGTAEVTSFRLSQSLWVDTEGIYSYQFFYSFDDGEIYLPIESTNQSQSSMNFTFDAIYEAARTIKVKCKATNKKGFSNFVLASATLQSKLNTDVSKNLEAITINSSFTEAKILQTALRLQLITQNLGSLKYEDTEFFDPKLEEEDCNNQLCSNKGKCFYFRYNKKYFCNCTGLNTGQNCTFSNATQLQIIKSLTEQLSLRYSQILNRDYEFEYLRILTVFKEQLNDVSLGLLISIFNSKIQSWQNSPQPQADIQNALTIVSRMLEYLDYEIMKNNVTGNWRNTTRYETTLDYFQAILNVLSKIRANTLLQINVIQSQLQFTTKMVSYRQILMNQESLIMVSATNQTKKLSQTFIKVSQLNFQNSSVYIEKDFIIEAIEFARNPFQIENRNFISNNIFEANFYNFSTRVQVPIPNITNGFELDFPFSDNKNLSEFYLQYSSISPYRSYQRLRRQEMINKSQLKCNFWNGTNWSDNGCKFTGLDTTHIRCMCHHLTAFAPQFVTPVLDSETMQIYQDPDINKTTEDYNEGPIKLEELLVPFDNYFKSLSELLQHKQPSPLDFLLKPGLYVVILFWFMYITSLIYYTGKDRIRRYTMTKSQNREDLAEIKDNEVQCLDQVIKELLIRDAALNAAQILNRNDKLAEEKQIEIDKIKPKIYEELPSDLQKEYRKRARRKVFGRVGTLCERTKRHYKKIYLKDPKTTATKIKFIQEQLKNNYWFSLMGRTSKIAPRHVRLTLMYFTHAMHLFFATFIYTFGYQVQLDNLIGENNISNSILSAIIIFGVWAITIPVGLIFRMPHNIKRQIEGVRTKKINKVFHELDKQMGWRYALGYFVCYFCYLLMTLMVLFFSYFYPTNYCLDWLVLLLFIFFLDFIILTFVFAIFQLGLVVFSTKLKWLYHVWTGLEILRYVKNVRG